MQRRRALTRAKWTMTVAALVLLAAAISSVWVGVLWVSPDRTRNASFGWGLVIIDRWSSPTSINQTGFSLDVSDDANYFFAYTHIKTSNGSYESWHLPLWPLILALAAPACALWRSERRFGKHQCRNCGYDRRGLAADTKCPECGTSTSPAPK